jgi:hypothetical protein
MIAMTPTKQAPTPKWSDQTAQRRDRSSTTFRKRIRSGNFEAVIGRGLRRTLQAAAADPGLDLEIGALRLVLLRLLREEPELPRLAVGIARLSSVAVVASRQRADQASAATDFQQIFLQELESYERELEIQRAGTTSPG